jgi:hypothetical protein
MILPASWPALLESFRPVFRRRGTFTLFTVLATGLVLQAGRRSVAGMLAGAGMASKISFRAACRFFSSAVRDIDALCLIAARLIVTRLLEDDAPIVVAVEDTLFKRWGRKVCHAIWTYDGPAQGGTKIARGNRWIIAGMVVRLPFVTAPLCLPVLFRLWRERAPEPRANPDLLVFGMERQPGVLGHQPRGEQQRRSGPGSCLVGPGSQTRLHHLRHRHDQARGPRCRLRRQHPGLRRSRFNAAHHTSCNSLPPACKGRWDIADGDIRHRMPLAFDASGRIVTFASG